jgi:predicted nucleic acid-binding protein
MAGRTDAYVDTSALIAFADKSDSYHTLFHHLFSDPPRLWTTSLVVSEGHAWFLRRYDRHRGLMFLALVEQLRPLRVASVGSAEMTGATALLRRFSDQDLTIVDAAGLHLMQIKRIRSCWSTDFHLSLTGVPLVIH